MLYLNSWFTRLTYQRLNAASTAPPLWANNKIRLLVTAACNIRCFYCHNEGQPKGERFLSQYLLNYVITALRRSPRPPTLTISGGEPLLHPSLSDYVRELRPHVAGVTLVTNGLLLSDKRVSTLIRHGVGKFRIGLDSIARPKSRPTPGDAPIDIVLNAIQEIRQAGAIVELNIVISKFNSRELRQLLEFCVERDLSAKFFEHVRFSRGAALAPSPIHRSLRVEFAEFDETVHRTLGAVSGEPCPHLGQANTVYRVGPSIIRYCRCLCDFDLCYSTGTRIDPDGYVYTCFGQRGRKRIVLGDSEESACSEITAAFADRESHVQTNQRASVGQEVANHFHIPY